MAKKSYLPAPSSYTPMKCIENIVPDLELYSFQNIGIAKTLLETKQLLGFDTGTGKTVVSSVIIRALLNRDPERKHIFVAINASLEQTYNVVSSLTAVPTATFTGGGKETARLQYLWDRTSIFIVTYESFRNFEFTNLLFRNLPQIESITIDECHHISNWDNSTGAFVIRALVKYIPYVCGLSATPAISNQAQFYRVMNVLDRTVSAQRQERQPDVYAHRYYPVDRADYDIKGNYKTTLEVVLPMKHQIGKLHGNIFKTLKGNGAVNQVDTLLRVVKQRLQQGKTVIIYVHLHEVREWVEQHLAENKITFKSLTGKTKKREERAQIIEEFSQRKFDVLITSVSESLNIESDVVIFYELTSQLKQVMGRAHRGLTPKDLELVFILTKDSEEIDYFQTYIYVRSITLQKILKKDYSEFIKIGESLKNLSIASDIGP